MHDDIADEMATRTPPLFNPCRGKTQSILENVEQLMEGAEWSLNELVSVTGYFGHVGKAGSQRGARSLLRRPNGSDADSRPCRQLVVRVALGDNVHREPQLRDHA